MFKFRTSARTAAIALFVTTVGIQLPALAGDTAGKAYASAPYSWTGFYLGVHSGPAAGLNNGASAVTLIEAPELTDPVSFGRKSNLGAVGGLQAGYNWQFNSLWVVGAEIDFSFASVSNPYFNNHLGSNVGPLGPTNSFALESHLNWLTSARARVGYAWDKSLVYITGGAAWANIGYNAIRNYAAVPPNNAFSTTATSPGWVAGIGGEMMMPLNFLLRAEYLYYSFASSQSGSATCGPTIVCGIIPSVISYSWGNSSVHVGRVGLSYKF